MKVRRFLFACMAMVLASVASETASAQQPSVDQAVNLIGVWDMAVTEGEYGDGHRWDHNDLEAYLDVTSQNGGIVHATFHATLESGRAHDGEQHVSVREVEMIGVISWSEDMVTFASHGARDHWVFIGRIVNSETIELMAYETGDHGWVSRNIAVRR